MALCYKDRIEAGKCLGSELRKYADRTDVIVLGLPRGGVPVAFEVATALRLPLDVFVVRKLGVPGYRELAMGAIATGGTLVFNEDVIHSLDISSAVIQKVMEHERKELGRREYAYRGNRPAPNLEGRTVILVDDGMATGSTMRAAVAAVHRQKPARVIVAVPVAAESTCEDLKLEVDELVCPLTPKSLSAVGAWYDNFSPTTDAEVQAILDRSAHEVALTGA